MSQEQQDCSYQMEKKTGEMFVNTCHFLTFLLEELSKNDVCLPSETFATVNDLITKLSRLTQHLNNVKKDNNHSDISNQIYHHNGPSITDTPTKCNLPPLLHPRLIRNAFLNSGNEDFFMENYISYQQPSVGPPRGAGSSNSPTAGPQTSVQIGGERHPHNFHPFSTLPFQFFAPSTENDRNLTIKPGSVDQEHPSLSVQGNPEEVLSNNHKKMKIPCDVYITKKFDIFTDCILEGSILLDDITVYCRVCDEVINGVWTEHMEDSVHFGKSTRMKTLTMYSCLLCSLRLFGSKELILSYFEYHFRKIHVEECGMSWDMAVVEWELDSPTQNRSTCGSSNSNYSINYHANKKKKSRRKAHVITNKNHVKGSKTTSNSPQPKSILTPSPKIISNSSSIDENPSKSTSIHSTVKTIFTTEPSNNPSTVKTAVAKNLPKIPPSIQTPISSNQFSNPPSVKTTVAKKPPKNPPSVQTPVSSNQSNNPPTAKTTVVNKPSKTNPTVKSNVANNQSCNSPFEKSTVTNKQSINPPTVKIATANKPTNTPTNNQFSDTSTVTNDLSNIPPNVKTTAANKPSNTPPTAKTKKKKAFKNIVNTAAEDKKEQHCHAGNDPTLLENLDMIFNAFPESSYPEFDRLIIKRAKEWKKTSILIDMGYCNVCQVGLESAFAFLCHTMDHNESNPGSWTEQICPNCNFKVFGSDQSKYFDLPIHLEVDKLVKKKW